MTNDITINSIKSNYDGNNVTRTVEFSLGGGGNIWLGVARKDGVWTDNDGKPGLSEGDTITIGDEKVPWNDPRATEMAAKAEEEYKAFLEWKACVEKSIGRSGVPGSDSPGSRSVNEYKCDKNGGFLPDPELEIGQNVSLSECKLPGDVMLTRKNDKLISLVRSDGSWLFKQAVIGFGFNMPGTGAAQNYASCVDECLDTPSSQTATSFFEACVMNCRNSYYQGIVYDPLMLGVQPKEAKITKIEITGESHPDLKGLESVARSVSDAYVQNGKEACKERHDICAKMWGTEDFTERMNILRENGGFDLFDQCVEMK